MINQNPLEQFTERKQNKTSKRGKSENNTTSKKQKVINGNQMTNNFLNGTISQKNRNANRISHTSQPKKRLDSNIDNKAPNAPMINDYIKNYNKFPQENNIQRPNTISKPLRVSIPKQEDEIDYQNRDDKKVLPKKPPKSNQKYHLPVPSNKTAQMFNNNLVNMSTESGEYFPEYQEEEYELIQEMDLNNRQRGQYSNIKDYLSSKENPYNQKWPKKLLKTHYKQNNIINKTQRAQSQSGIRRNNYGHNMTNKTQNIIGQDQYPGFDFQEMQSEQKNNNKYTDKEIVNMYLNDQSSSQAKREEQYSQRDLGIVVQQKEEIDAQSIEIDEKDMKEPLMIKDDKQEEQNEQFSEIQLKDLILENKPYLQYGELAGYLEKLELYKAGSFKQTLDKVSYINKNLEVLNDV